MQIWQEVQKVSLAEFVVSGVLLEWSKMTVSDISFLANVAGAACTSGRMLTQQRSNNKDTRLVELQ